MAVECIPQLRDESVTEAGDAFCSGGNTEQVKNRFRFRCQHCFSLASCRMLTLRIWFSSVQWELQYQCWSHRICVCVCLLSRSVLSNSLQPHGLYPARLLCLWDSPGKNTGVGCHCLLQGIFPTQRSNRGLLALQADSLPAEPLEG